MLYVQSLLNIVDNSGAKLAKIIKILTPVSIKGRIKGTVGSLLLLTLKRVLPLKKVKKGNIYQAVFIRSKQFIQRVIGSLLFESNCGVLLNKRLEPIASRIGGLVSKEIREKKHSKIISMSKGVV